MNEDLAARIKNFPQSPGVYLMKNAAGDIIYVGKAKNLKKRVSQYFSNKKTGVKTEHLVAKIYDIETIIALNELDAFLLENNLIKQYKPRYNISLKDDKSYPYIKITKSRFDYPYIIKTRSFKSGQGEYFGPYSSAFAVTQTIKTINNIFKLRICSDAKFSACAAKKRPCLYYQINRCAAPCCGYISSDDYKKLIDNARLLLRGKNKLLLNELKKTMNKHVTEQNFEAAIKFRNKINAIVTINEKQATVLKNEKDIDAIGFYGEEDKINITVIIIRSGKVIDSRNYFFKNIYLNDNEMLSSFLNRYYSRALEVEGNIAGEILIPQDIDSGDKNSLLDYIKRFTSKKTKIITINAGKYSLNGGKSDVKCGGIMSMAADNAKKNFMEKTQRSGLRQEIGIYSDADSTDNVKNDAKNKTKVHQPEGREKAEKYHEKGIAAPTSFAKEERILELLKAVLHLNKFPEVIECFDISNISGTYAVASKAVFNGGKKAPSMYRKYRIRSKNTPDDYAMMYEALYRRFNNAVQGKDPLPDAIMVDGGKGQLNVLVKVAREFNRSGLVNPDDMPDLFAIAKARDVGKKIETDNIYLPNRKNEVNFGKNTPAVFLLMQLRDEAHRFAVAYYSKLKGKSLVTSELLNIKGVGKNIYKYLMDGFGSVKNVKNASISELSDIKGVNKTAAKNIFNYFHRQD